MGEDVVSRAEFERAIEDLNTKLDTKLSVVEFERRYAMLETTLARHAVRLDAIVDRMTKVEVKVDAIQDAVVNIDKNVTVLAARFDGFVKDVSRAGQRNLVIVSILVVAAVGVVQALHL